MAPTAVKRFALDVNLVLDRAAGADFALRLFKALHGQGYSFILPPTALVELTLIAKTFAHPSNQLALCGLKSLNEWGIGTCDLIPVGHGITDLFARTLITRGLLPEDEFNRRPHPGGSLFDGSERPFDFGYALDPDRPNDVKTSF
jgi:hypothetical protein